VYLQVKWRTHGIGGRSICKETSDMSCYLMAAYKPCIELETYVHEAIQRRREKEKLAKN
jgi:hypothetical protein